MPRLSSGAGENLFPDRASPLDYFANREFGKGQLFRRRKRHAPSNPYVHFKMTAGLRWFFSERDRRARSGENYFAHRTHRHRRWRATQRSELSFLEGRSTLSVPVTYWVETNSWVNSPSYPDGSPHFDKDIIPRCLECHASYFEWVPTAVNRYRKNSLVLGIMCEKCHGPGQQHVALHRKTAKLGAGTPEAIVNPAKLTRDRRLDVCGLCHSGNGMPIAPSLSFVPGDDLRDYVDIPYVSPEEAVDVHGNQVQLLRKSRCFLASNTLTCDTCHDVHKTQRDAAVVFISMPHLPSTQTMRRILQAGRANFKELY